MRIQDEDHKSRILQAIGDEDKRRIFTLMVRKAKSASDLSFETHMPLSSVYRHVHELNSAGLLAVEQFIINDQGKKVEMFRSVVESISLNLESSVIDMNIQPKEDMQSRFYRLWSSLKEVK